MFRLTRIVAAAGLFLAGLLFLWLTFSPGGLGQVFGDDEFEPLAGFIFLGISLIACVGVARWSRLRWLGFLLAALGVAFWVPFVLNTRPAGASPLFIVFYVSSTAALVASAILEASASQEPGRPAG